MRTEQPQGADFQLAKTADFEMAIDRGPVITEHLRLPQALSDAALTRRRERKTPVSISGNWRVAMVLRIPDLEPLLTLAAGPDPMKSGSRATARPCI
jgi:hypothetical protein